MVRASVTITPPPGRRSEVLRALRTVVGPTRAKHGCRACHVLEDVEDGTIVVLEEWDTEEAMTHHLRSHDYLQLLVLMETSTRPPEVRFEIIASASGMEVIEAARNG